MSGRTDVNEASKRAPGEVHGSGVRLADGLGVRLRTDSNHELVSDDATAHVPAHHEGEPAEHPLLHYIALTAQGLTEPISKLLIVGQ
jgi:hypothetical protein